MRKGCLYIAILLICFGSKAFHIVGGEIEYLYLGDGLYRINLIQYFDWEQDQNPGPEAFVTVFIFRNSDNREMSQHTLMLDTIELLENSNPQCNHDGMEIGRIVYTSEVELLSDVYNDAAGYYIQWERCCRNAGITNLVASDGTGMTYVLEIPAVASNNQPIKNSSPQLPPLSWDYACINQPYHKDFKSTDLDGDSLAYSLVAPLNSSAQVAVPRPQPKPHFKVVFASGYSETNMIPGEPELTLNNQGLMTIHPSETGLFLYSVLVEEFRNGAKIGEVRREFQLYVVDSCDPPDPPVVEVEMPENQNFDPEIDTLIYTVSDTTCIDLLVRNIRSGQLISFATNGVDFNGSLDDVLSVQQKSVENVDEFEVQVCFSGCPPKPRFVLDLIAFDDRCPIPQSDTVRLLIQSLIPTTGLSKQTQITSFEIPEQTKDAMIDTINHTVEIEVARGTDLSCLVPSFTVSSSAISEPESGTTFNFVNGPVPISVKAENCQQEVWAVTVTEALNSETDFLAFTFTEDIEDGTINPTAHTILKMVSETADVSSLSPTYLLSEGATATPLNQTEIDFTNPPVVFTVTAEDGITHQEWEVFVSAEVVLGDVNPSNTILWPNPVGDFLHVKTTREYQTIKLLNLAGTEVLSLAKNSNNSGMLDLHTLNAGVYILRIEGHGEIADYRIIKN